MIVDESVGESSYQFCVQWSDVEFVKSFTAVRFPHFSILPEKMRKSRNFWPKIENGGGSGRFRMDQNKNVMDG